MLIFNTTYKISANQVSDWIRWAQDEHIAFMLSDAVFSHPQIAKVVGSEDDTGVSYSIQFHIDTMDRLMQWHKANASNFQRNCAAKFGSDVQFFTTVLEIIA
ncbi:MAG: hypothetical protein AUK44_09285 [Porphyromonadaceae bacterium CG2_30_38_12]|nr:MAG: hypothetical protein AUK44_09285 [Porphyromonadaceae bacterium CG2_30_38_12]